MKQVLYHHPDGAGTISYDTQTQSLGTANAAKGTASKATIGPQGLRELAEKLLAQAKLQED